MQLPIVYKTKQNELTNIKNKKIKLAILLFLTQYPITLFKKK